MQLHHRRSKRDHDLGMWLAAGLDTRGLSLRNGTHLQREQARDHDAQAHTAQTEHGVRLVHAHHGRKEKRVPLYVGARLPAFLRQGDLHGEFGQVRQELVERWVDKPDGDRQPIHLGEQPDEVLALQGEQCVESGLPLLVRGSQDHVLDQLAPFSQELVFRAA